MRGRGGWLGGMAVAIVLAIGVARAADAPATATTPAAAPASEEACVAACKQLIDRCTGVFGPAMGDMRPFCTRAVMRRCRANGLAACEAVAR